MRTHKLLAIGLLMLGSGAFLLFGDSATFPLWFTWIIGPLLWYLGLVITPIAVMMTLFVTTPGRAPELYSERMTVLRLRRFSHSPAGILHEIPSMGGFIL